MIVAYLFADFHTFPYKHI